MTPEKRGAAIKGPIDADVMMARFVTQKGAVKKAWNNNSCKEDREGFSANICGDREKCQNSCKNPSVKLTYGLGGVCATSHLSHSSRDRHTQGIEACYLPLQFASFSSLRAAEMTAMQSSEMTNDGAN